MPQKTLLFVDSIGGGLAALGASIARANGSSGALAATTAEAATVPAEIATVLEEVGMSALSVAPLGEEERSGETIIWLGAEPPPARFTGAQSIACALFEGEGELERLVCARIARDRIERSLERLQKDAS